LDAFMAGIEKEVKKDTRMEKVEVPKKETEKGVRGDIDNEDDEESYYRLTQ
jgi:ATP-dependent RNA helicase DDX42